MCVCEREREGQRARDRDRDREGGAGDREKEGGRERKRDGVTDPPKDRAASPSFSPSYAASLFAGVTDPQCFRDSAASHPLTPAWRVARRQAWTWSRPFCCSAAPRAPAAPASPRPARPKRPDSTRQEGGRVLGPPLRLAPSLAESFLAQILWAAKGLGAGSAGPGPGPARMGVLSSIPSRLGPGSGPVLQVRVPAACGVRGAGGVSAYSPPPLLDQLGPPARHPSLVSNFSDLRVRLWRDDMRT